MSTHTEFAGKRSANAVRVFLESRTVVEQTSALSGLKLVYGEYREAEERNRIAQAANDLQDGEQ